MEVLIVSQYGRILVATLSFLLDYEKIEDGDDSDASSSEDESAPHNPQAVISKEAVYKVNSIPYGHYIDD